MFELALRIWKPGQEGLMLHKTEVSCTIRATQIQEHSGCIYIGKIQWKLEAKYLVTEEPLSALE